MYEVSFAKSTHHLDVLFHLHRRGVIIASPKTLIPKKPCLGKRIVNTEQRSKTELAESSVMHDTGGRGNDPVLSRGAK